MRRLPALVLSRPFGRPTDTASVRDREQRPFKPDDFGLDSHRSRIHPVAARGTKKYATNVWEIHPVTAIEVR
jgi:hypothetical protein